MIQRLSVVFGLSVLLLGAAPTVLGFGVSAASTTTIQGVTLSATPTAAPSTEFVADVFSNGPTPTPTSSPAWATLCQGSNGTTRYAVYYRPTNASDTTTTVQVLASAQAQTTIGVYEASNFAGFDGACNQAYTAGTTTYPVVTPSFSPTYNSDTILGFANAFGTGTFSANPTYTQCAALSNDANAINGNAATKYADFIGNATGISTAFSCAMTYNIGVDVPTTTKVDGMVVALQGGTLLKTCVVGGLLLLGVGC